jgi:NADPH-dependent ferric siderophore reductase
MISPDATLVAVRVSLVDPVPVAESVTRASLVPTGSGARSLVPPQAAPTVAKIAATIAVVRSMVSSLGLQGCAQGNRARSSGRMYKGRARALARELGLSDFPSFAAGVATRWARQREPGDGGRLRAPECVRLMGSGTGTRGWVCA